MNWKLTLRNRCSKREKWTLKVRIPMSPRRRREADLPRTLTDQAHQCPNPPKLSLTLRMDSQWRKREAGSLAKRTRAPFRRNRRRKTKTRNLRMESASTRSSSKWRDLRVLPKTQSQNKRSKRESHRNHVNLQRAIVIPHPLKIVINHRRIQRRSPRQLSLSQSRLSRSLKLRLNRPNLNRSQISRART